MIFVLIGRSGSGKSTIEKEVSKNLGLERLVSTTTRPIRGNEVNGVDYNYITRNEFEEGLKNNEFVEHAIYRDNYYGISKKSVNNNKDYITVTEPQGYHSLVEVYGDDVVGIVIIMDGKERMLNYLQREENPNVFECCKRYLADEECFREIEESEEVYHVINKFGMLVDSIEEVEKIINRHKEID